MSEGRAVEVVSFDDWAAARGIPASPPSEPGLHKNVQAGAARTRALRRLSEAELDWQQARNEARAAYEAAVTAGRVRPPTRIEALERVAAGHPDNEAVRAARRVLARRHEATS